MINKKPRISVVLPVYNLTRFLRPALESVRKQTLQDFEVIVVDDGSRDPESIRDIAAGMKFERLKVIRHPENRGLSAARNTGLLNAEGDYIVFLDSDDLFLPEKFAVQSRLLDDNPAYAMVYSDEYHLNGTEERWEERPVQFGAGTPGPSGWILDDFLKRSFIAVMTVMIRSQVIRELGGFDQALRYNEDDFLWYRVMIEHPVLFSDYVSGVRRLHETNMSGDREKMTHFQLHTFRRLLSLYPKAIKPRRHIVTGRLRNILKSYLKYCLFERHLPNAGTLKDFYQLMKASVILIYGELPSWFEIATWSGSWS